MLRIVRAQVEVVLALGLASTAAASGVLRRLRLCRLIPQGASLALERYLAGAGDNAPWSEPNSVLLEIDATLPRLAECGNLRAIRRWPERQTPGYQVIGVEGDATVKQQVIARYLTAEKVSRCHACFVGCGDTGELLVPLSRVERRGTTLCFSNNAPAQTDRIDQRGIVDRWRHGSGSSRGGVSGHEAFDIRAPYQNHTRHHASGRGSVPPHHSPRRGCADCWACRITDHGEPGTGEH